MNKWLFIVMLITAAVRAGAYSIPYETWMGAYVGESKVGYLSLNIDTAEIDGVQGYKIASVINNRMTILGVTLTQLISAVVFTDSKYNPLREELSMASGGKTTTINAKFGKDKVFCVISAGSGTSTKAIPIPKGANLVGDAMFAIFTPAPDVGKVYNLSYFNPLTLSIDDLKVTVERSEKITVGGKEYETVVMKNATSMGDMTVWQEPSGEVVKVEAVMGINLIRQGKEDAIAGVNGGGEDFAVRTRVKTDRTIESPRTVKSLDIVLTTLDDPKLMITDSLQKVTKVEEQSGSVRVITTSSSFDAGNSIKLPIQNQSLAEFIASTPYVNCKEAAVKKKAAEIVGKEKNAYKACSKIRSWMNENMQVRADIGITRSASDVLKSKMGVCRDYAILFAGLARSLEIPTKVVSGMLYLDDGFYYHAWVECYVGKWIPFDATLPTDFVDATHIKLAEGDATSMFSLAKVIGNLSGKVISYQ